MEADGRKMEYSPKVVWWEAIDAVNGICVIGFTIQPIKNILTAPLNNAQQSHGDGWFRPII